MDGELVYGNISSKEAGKRYRGEIVFNSEEDIHLPTLNVSQTLSVSHRLKRPAALAQNMNAKEYAQDQIDRVLNMFGSEWLNPFNWSPDVADFAASTCYFTQ